MLIGRTEGTRNHPFRATARSTNFTYVESVIYPSPSPQTYLFHRRLDFHARGRKSRKTATDLFFPFFPSRRTTCARMWKRVHGKGVCAFSPNNSGRARALMTSALLYAPFLATALMKPLICIASKSAAVVVVKSAATARCYSGECAVRITAFRRLDCVAMRDSCKTEKRLRDAGRISTGG